MTAFATAEWLAVLAFAAIAGGAGLAGVWLMVRHEGLARRHTGELVVFASGLLVAGSLLHLLPHGGELTGPVAASGWALAAFALLFVAENHFLAHPHGRADEPPHGRGVSGMAAVLGLGLHGVLDGVAVGAGFSASLLTGGVIIFLVVSHKLPVGIASMGILYHTGLDRRRAARYSVIVALLTPLAVLASYVFLRDASEPVLGALIGGAGGAFLYVGAADLLPEGQSGGLLRSTLLFLVGVAVVVLLLAVAGPP